MLIGSMCGACLEEKATFTAGTYPDMRPEENPDPGPDEDLSTKDIVRIAPLTNPGTGYHLEIKYVVSPDGIEEFFNPFTTPWSYYPAGFIEDGVADNNAGRDELHLSQLYFYLSEFHDSETIPESAIANMQQILDAFRENGYKVILRLAYDPGDISIGREVRDEALLKSHLNQLREFILRNINVIATVQAGTIGLWGEWHTTSLAASQSARNAVVNTWLDILPESYCIEVRLPEYKRALTLDDPSDANCIGIHNDYFTAGQHPMAPGSDVVPGTEDYAEAASYAPYCYMSGEMPYDEDSDYGLGFNLDVNTTLRALRDQHYSGFNLTHNNNRNFPNWQLVKVYPKMLDGLQILYSEDYFREADGELVPRSMYEFIRDHLGYRLNCLPTSSVGAESGNLVYDIRFTNTGFATVVNPVEVYLVLIDGNDQVVKEFEVDTDPRTWQPYAPGDSSFTVLEHVMSGSVPAGVSGTYRVGIWMLDGAAELANNRYDNRFDVKWGLNGQLSHWRDAENKYCVNVIGEVTF